MGTPDWSAQIAEANLMPSHICDPPSAAWYAPRGRAKASWACHGYHDDEIRSHGQR